ncbi:MAG: 3-dehydroquinate synthase [Chloroflexi bacterium]|nr:3-dehydroquinate synthase [Chloroflexota bacterium]
MPNLILTGFSGTGKTAIGRAVANTLAWPFVDTDQEIVQRTGKPIDRVFAEDGEPHFRRLEREVLAEACARDSHVIATGGGAIADQGNRELMLRRGVVVCIRQRLATGEGDGSGPEVRPLLQGPESPSTGSGQALERIRQLKAQRQPYYALAHWTVHTDHLAVEEAAREVVRAFARLRESLLPQDVADDDLAAFVHTSLGSYPVYVGWGLLEGLGQRLGQLGLPPVVYVVSDEEVFRQQGRRLQYALEAQGIAIHVIQIEPGEASKTLANAHLIYQWLAEMKAERGQSVLALGGGVVGDLGGFVASTYLRGMPLVQLPTSLAAMVDASIGGKTAVDFPQGKNLVGTFYQPRMVLADLEALETLPRRELISGWAEAVKHGLILDGELFQTCEANVEGLLSLEPALTARIVRRSAAIKAGVVSQDERETTGYRTLLNYGHTIGHALETVGGYRKYLHGEAVAIGMTGAALISQKMGLLSQADAERQENLLRSLGLPTRCPGERVERLLQVMEWDKKVQDGTLRWVLLEGIGKAVIRSDVPRELVEEVAQQLTRGQGQVSG